MFGDVAQQLDPQKEYDGRARELFRCCLLRTLMSYNGRPTEGGGAIPRPDLAADLPEVSNDGMMWTFHIRSGIRYAPPFENTEITAGDFVTAIKRTLRVRVEGENAPGAFGTTAFYFRDVIEGAAAYAVGKSATISGLETPDERTLIVHLTQPTGDLNYRFAMPTTAPIPPSPTDPDAPFGAATGHDDSYGRFLVAAGPYMIEGSSALDFTLPPSEQAPVSGYAPGRSIVFVPNPSWHQESDPLRGAFTARMEFSLFPQDPGSSLIKRLASQVDRGVMDLVLDPNWEPPRQLDRYDGDPALRDRVHSTASGFVTYLAMNLAVPPFDDPSVRRAVNLVIDKAALARVFAFPSRLTTHIAPDALEDDLLSSYDPYATPHDRGSVELARAEMARSAYDRNGDGVCDAPVCRNVDTTGLICSAGDLADPIVASVSASLSKIGILLGGPAPCPRIGILLDPEAHIPISAHSWGPDYPDASGFLQQLFTFTGVGTLSDSPDRTFTMVGASPDRLHEWGYAVDRVPSIDDRVAQCIALTFEPRIECWARLDQVLMAQVVPWVPLVDAEEVWIASGNVAAFSVDQSLAMPALDRIVVASNGG